MAFAFYLQLFLIEYLIIIYQISKGSLRAKSMHCLWNLVSTRKTSALRTIAKAVIGNGHDKMKLKWLRNMIDGSPQFLIHKYKVMIAQIKQNQYPWVLYNLARNVLHNKHIPEANKQDGRRSNLITETSR